MHRWICICRSRLSLLADALPDLHMTLRFIYGTVGWCRTRNLTQPAQSPVFKKRIFCCATHPDDRSETLFFATMSMTVKAYLLGKDDCNKEIRRFAVDQDVSTSFEYLKRKVLDVFVGLRTAPFQMYYKGKSVFNSFFYFILCSLLLMQTYNHFYFLLSIL